MKSFYFYSVASSPDPKAHRDLWAFEADDEKTAAERLYQEHGKKPFFAVHVGSFASEDLQDAVLRPTPTGDPLNTVQALRYIEEEYGDDLGEKKTLKRIRKKLFKHLFVP